MAMPVQYLSAKLGIVTGRDLAQICGSRYGAPVRFLLWVQAEGVAMATDLAEFVGAAIGLNLLFGVPPSLAGFLVALVAFLLLGLRSRGFRRYELAIIGLLAVVVLGFLYELVRSRPDTGAAVAGLIPSFRGGDSVLLAVGIVGATVMPHVVYLHSALTVSRVPGPDRDRALRFQRHDVAVALGLAGLVNAAMLVFAARLFHNPAYSGISTLREVHAGIGATAGGGAALVFAIALLASGVSSSSVGTHAGQVVMRGLLRVSVPVTVRRLVTMLPAVAVLCSGTDPTAALLLSQVVLSFGIPFAVIPLVLITRDPAVMGRYANHPVMTVATGAIALVITVVNVYLLLSLA